MTQSTWTPGPPPLVMSVWYVCRTNYGAVVALQCYDISSRPPWVSADRELYSASDITHHIEAPIDLAKES